MPRDDVGTIDRGDRRAGGLDNVIVVDTNDALLVVARAQAQEVKKVVERLKEIMRDKLT